MKGNVKYFLGIDGGGTKTEFLLTDSIGNGTKRLFLGGSNPVSQGIENTFSVLENGITEICKGYDLGGISVFAGVAGINTGEYRSLISSFLSRFGFASFACGSDVDLALEIALKGGDGTAVIMGTGIVAYSRSGEKLHRAGGRGYMIDGGGSGFHFGSDALNSAFEYIDGTGGSEKIFRLAEDKIGKKLEDSVADIYGGGVPFVASFAPVVFEAYNLGDAVAAEIIDRNSFEAAKIINGAKRKTEGRVVISGGLCKQKEILSPYIMKYIEGDVPLVFLDEPMVNGAVSLARRMCEND